MKTILNRANDCGNQDHGWLKAARNGAVLDSRDALGSYDTEAFDISISADAKILIIEVPME